MKKMRIKINYKRKVLPKNIWLAILAVFIVITLISGITTVFAYQEPITTEEKNTVLTYSGNSQFNYLTTLVNNTVYNKTLLRPGEGIIFKQIVDNITGTHQYQFSISQSATISATYSLKAIIQTDLWTKTYPIIESSSYESTGTRLTVSESFPIDFRFYDNILTTINEEIGINAPNPILLIQASTSVSAKTDEYTISDTFNPEITMSLNRKTIEFSDMLSLSKSGSKTETITINHPEVEEARQSRLLTTFITGFILVIYLLFTKMQPTEMSALEKELHKIQKKYGEWIVKAESNPVDPLSKSIMISSMEELSRISEDLGKPMIHYTKGKKNHMFAVIDDEHIYQHELKVSKRQEKDLFSFFSAPKKMMKSSSDADKINEEKNNNLNADSLKKNHYDTIVTCKHCKSSFAIEEEITDDVKHIEVSCPYCEERQRISIEPGFLEWFIHSFFKKKENRAF